MNVDIEKGSGRIATVAAVIIMIATFIYFNNWKWLIPGLMLAALGYGIVYFACVWILKGFINETKGKREVDK